MGSGYSDPHPLHVIVIMIVIALTSCVSLRLYKTREAIAPLVIWGRLSNMLGVYNSTRDGVGWFPGADATRVEQPVQKAKQVNMKTKLNKRKVDR